MNLPGYFCKSPPKDNKDTKRAIIVTVLHEPHLAE